MAWLRSECQGSGVFAADSSIEPGLPSDHSDEARSLTEIEHVLQLPEAAAIAAERSDEDLAQIGRWLEFIDASISAGDAADHRGRFCSSCTISAATGNPYFERFMHSLGPSIIPPRSIRPQSENPRAAPALSGANPGGAPAHLSGNRAAQRLRSARTSGGKPEK